MALKWHPVQHRRRLLLRAPSFWFLQDKHAGAAKQDADDKFKKVAEAYEVLSDPKKKQV